MSEGTPLHEKNPMMRLSGRYLKWTAYGLLVLFACILQSTPRLLPTIAGASPLLIIPIVVAIAMYTGPIGGAAAGIGGGLLWDLYSSRLFGFNALILLLIGCACGLLVRLLIRNNVLSAMLLVTGALMIQGFLDWFCNYVLLFKENLVYVLVCLILPDLLYTLLLTPLLYAGVFWVTKILRNRE